MHEKDRKSNLDSACCAEHCRAHRFMQKFSLEGGPPNED